MFIAMNRFRVAKGSEAAFEQVWMSRDSHLEKVPGFVEFHLLKGPEAEDHTLYASHTVWENRKMFEALTKSEAFRAAHSRAGDNKPLYLDHPQLRGSRFARRWDAARVRWCDACASGYQLRGTPA
jgi:heme-degrading monooxygenase HmoA